jgi:hypothetical protein
MRSDTDGGKMMDKRDEGIGEIMEEYEHAGRKRRLDMGFIFLELRDKFDKIEHPEKYPSRKFGVDPSQICCGR